MSKRRIRAGCTRIKNKEIYMCVPKLREEPPGSAARGEGTIRNKKELY